MINDVKNLQQIKEEFGTVLFLSRLNGELCASYQTAVILFDSCCRVILNSTSDVKLGDMQEMVVRCLFLSITNTQDK